MRMKINYYRLCKQVCKLIEKICSTKNWCLLNNCWNSLCANNNSKFVACPSGRKHYFGELYPRDLVCNIYYADFENIKMRVMDGYDYYFRKLYGDDYMTPPIEKREIHSIIELDLGKYETQKGR